MTVALTKIVADVLAANGLPGAIASTCVGGTDVGEWMTNDPRFPLISFTGSTKVGRIVSETVHRRFGRTILELGGNNATIGMCLCVAVVCSLLSAHRGVHRSRSRQRCGCGHGCPCVRVRRCGNRRPALHHAASPGTWHSVASLAGLLAGLPFLR